MQETNSYAHLKVTYFFRFLIPVVFFMQMRVGGSVKTQLSWDRIYWLDDDDMF